MGNSPKELDVLFESWKDGNGNRWRVEVDFKTIDGRQMPVELRVRAVAPGYALTQSIIRALPLAGTVDQYFRVKGFRVEVDRSPRSPRAKRVNKEYSDEELTVVANLYREAFKAHRPVQATVAQELKIPISTAAKQIAAARRRNFLGPATRRRPGEHPEVNEKVK